MFKAEDTHGVGILDGIRHDYSAFLKGDLKIVTSTVTIAEVAEGQFENVEDFKKFKDLRYANGFLFSESSVPIMDRASEIKDYYYNNPLGASGEYKHLHLGDAIHLATALIVGVDSFVTLDSKNKAKAGEIGLLKLVNPIAGKYSIHITKPVPPAQPGLPGVPND